MAAKDYKTCIYRRIVCPAISFIAFGKSDSIKAAFRNQETYTSKVELFLK